MEIGTDQYENLSFEDFTLKFVKEKFSAVTFTDIHPDSITKDISFTNSYQVTGREIYLHQVEAELPSEKVIKDLGILGPIFAIDRSQQTGNNKFRGIFIIANYGEPDASTELITRNIVASLKFQ